MTDTCEHGAQRNRPWPDGIVWMEGTGTCGCCGTVFACWYGHVPADRCKDCGGREKTLDEAAASFAIEPVVPPKTLAERLTDYKLRKRAAHNTNDG